MKRLSRSNILPRLSTTASSATPTINTDLVDMYGLTAQAADITSFTTNLSGTPIDGQSLRIYIVGTATRAITWGASFEAGGIDLPTTTVGTNRLDVGFTWNAATTKWRCVAVSTPSTAIITNPYKFSAYRNAAANTGNAAFAQIVFDTEIYDSNNNFATGTYTAPIAGTYEFKARASVQTGTRFILSLFKNGNEYHRGGDIVGTSGGAVVSTDVQLAASDTVDIRAFGSGALALDVGSTVNTYFNGSLKSQN